MEMTLLKAQTENAKLPHVRTIGQILMQLAHLSERTAELIEQDLTVKEMSLEACGKALKEYARQNQEGGCWACGVFGLDADNPALKVILDFYKIPSDWVFTSSAAAEDTPLVTCVTSPSTRGTDGHGTGRAGSGTIDLMDLL